MVKISSFIIALVLVGLVASGFGIFMGEMNNNYAVSDYDNSTFDGFDKLSELTKQVEDTQNATALEVEPTITDIIGGYFKSAYQALRISSASVTTFGEITETAAEKSNIPHINLIKGALVTIVLILIFIGVLISAMVKKDV